MSTSSSADIERLATKAFSEQMPYGLVVLDHNYRAVWASTGFGRLLGYDLADLIGRQMTDLAHADDLAPLMPVGAEMLELVPTLVGGPSPAWAVELPVRMRAADGRWVPMSVTGRYLTSDGKLLLCYRLATDRHAFAAVIGAVMGDVPLRATLDRLIDLARSQLGARTGWVAHDAFGELEITHADELTVGVGDLAGYLAALRRGDIHPSPHARSERWIAPVVAPRPPGTTGDYLGPVQASQILGVLVLDLAEELNPYEKYVLHGVTELIALVLGRAVVDERLQVAATTDALTGLLNRRELEHRLTAIAEQPSSFPVSLLFLDLDDFKDVNDQHGHPVGDAVLVAVGRRLAAAVRDHDSPARTGGDEFAVLCPTLPAEEAARVGDRLVAVLGEPVHVAGLELRITASVGAATAADVAGLAGLIARADDAMYDQKRSVTP